MLGIIFGFLIVPVFIGLMIGAVALSMHLEINTFDMAMGGLLGIAVLIITVVILIKTFA